MLNLALSKSIRALWALAVRALAVKEWCSSCAIFGASASFLLLLLLLPLLLLVQSLSLFEVKFACFK